MGLGLLRGDEVHYYGVVNVGDANGLKKAMQETNLKVEDDSFTQSLFGKLGDPVSDINVLIGSRRFAEGWDNYRASSLTLLRLGQGEGSLIIQMFGRVVRFAGRNGDGKRLSNPVHELRPLQTAYTYGLRSSYLEAFLKSLYANGVPQTLEKSCEVEVYLPGEMPLHSVQTIAPEMADFHVSLLGNRWVEHVNKVKFSLTAAVYTSAITRDGVKSEKGVMGQDILPSSLSIRRDSDLVRLNRTAAAIVRRLFESAYRREENRYSRYAFINADKSGIPKSYRKERIHVQS